MFCEQIAESLEAISKHPATSVSSAGLCIASASLLIAAERGVNKVQEANTEAASTQVRQFLPQDFRGSLLEMRRAQQEKANLKAVEDLMKKGGSIRDRYTAQLENGTLT